MTGPDGVGKTTFSRMLVKELLHRGIDVKHGWTRYRNYLSKPLLAYTRLIGLNYYEENQGYLHGYHDFHKSTAISMLFPILQTIDVNLATYFRIVRRTQAGGIMICDRGPFDTLVDVMIDTGNANLGKGIFFYLYLALVRNKCKLIVLDRSFDNIVKTKMEIKYDKKIFQKIKLYRFYANHYSLPIVDNNGDIETTFANIKRAIGIPS